MTKFIRLDTGEVITRILCTAGAWCWLTKEIPSEDLCIWYAPVSRYGNNDTLFCNYSFINENAPGSVPIYRYMIQLLEDPDD